MRPLQERVECLRRYAECAAAAAPRMAALITREVGKTLAEATAEAGLLAEKVNITLDPVSMSRVTGYQVSAGATRSGNTHFMPLGVMGVIGPFNFPAHLPNGHIVPALLLGNTVVFKPSEKAPAVAQLLATLLAECLPPGVFNLVQGSGVSAAALVDHPEVDGILFTGSWPVGRRILQANLDRPSRMVALEMGGNSPAVVLPDADLRQAVVECVRSAFATTGQRCTCTRRIIVHRSIAPRFIRALTEAARALAIGPGDSPQPVFMGPLVTDQARQAVLRFQEQAAQQGARVLLPCTPLDREGWFLSAGVLHVPRFEGHHDTEVFGPLVQVSEAADLDDAIAQANATQFGLAAACFTADHSAFQQFLHRCRAGCINWNTGTAGASGKLPFGGLGKSGNLRPAGAFSVDYCAVPVASMVERSNAAPLPAGMRMDEAWLA